jgi:hypothetical protein
MSGDADVEAAKKNIIREVNNLTIKESKLFLWIITHLDRNQIQKASDGTCIKLDNLKPHQIMTLNDIITDMVSKDVY